ncbi:MAG TPA: proton-conducting transporter membrane subunit [Candidatus Xenobia bacterium]
MSRAALSSLLPLAVALPLGGAVLAPLLGRVSRRLPTLVAALTLAGSTVLLGLMAPTVYGGRLLAHFMGHIEPTHGHALGISFAADPWGLTFALLTAALGSVLALYSLSELADLGRRELGGYTCLFLILCAALIGSALTADLFNLFVWFEVAALASYALTAFFLERPVALEAAFKILVLTTIASFAIFMAAALVYGDHGALNLGQIHQALQTGSRPADAVALALLIGGFATKAGLIPFHGWLPDAHTAAPGPISALFSGLMVNLGIVSIGRLVFEVFTPAGGHDLLGLLMVLGLVSAVGGALFALFQDDLKRLLAYDTVSQMGVLAVGLATGSAGGLAGTSYHLVNHALFKALLFLCAGSIVHMTGATKLSEMGGLGRRYPLLAVAFIVGVFSIAGLPPLNGYVSLGLIHDALRNTGQSLPLAVMLVAQVITIAALGKAAWLAFFRRRDADAAFERDETLHPTMRASLGLLAGGCLAFGVFPTWLLQRFATPAAAALLHPALYARGVMASGGPLSSASVSFDYTSWAEMVTVLATVLVAIAVAFAAMRWSGSRAVRALRRLQSGSVNDYAGYLVGGLLLVVVVLTRTIVA